MMSRTVTTSTAGRVGVEGLDFQPGQAGEQLAALELVARSIGFSKLRGVPQDPSARTVVSGVVGSLVVEAPSVRRCTRDAAEPGGAPLRHWRAWLPAAVRVDGA
jgi:hypothetical protein